MTTVDHDKPGNSVNPAVLWFVRVAASLALYYLALSYCIEGIAKYRNLKPEVAGAFAFLAVVNAVTLFAIVTICVLAVRVSLGKLGVVALLIGCLQPLSLMWFGFL